MPTNPQEKCCAECEPYKHYAKMETPWCGQMGNCPCHFKPEKSEKKGPTHEELFSHRNRRCGCFDQETTLRERFEERFLRVNVYGEKATGGIRVYFEAGSVQEIKEELLTFIQEEIERAKVSAPETRLVIKGTDPGTHSFVVGEPDEVEVVRRSVRKDAE